MKRNINDVIKQILALLPPTTSPALADEMIVLVAELNILNRTALYAPPESQIEPELWARLGTILYRYLPNPAGYPWAKAISDLVLA